MSDFRAHSFDSPRGRPAPRELWGRTLDGEKWRHTLTGLTLVVAVKPNCDGCREFTDGDLFELSGVEVVVMSATTNDEWRQARQQVIISPETLMELDLRSAPLYVLIDASRQRVVSEGVVFAPAQVAQEIASFLTR
ncbi:MAG: hypothetical protein ACRDVC_11425 [Acidimicrobiales bacterium]